MGMKGWGDGDCYGFASNAEVSGMLFYHCATCRI
jgi:hypothetical protein